MPQNMYDEPDGEADALTQRGAATSELDKTPTKDEDQSDAVAVLPRSILAGKDFKVGDEVVLEITEIGDDEVLVRYAPEKGTGEGDEDESVRPPDEGAPSYSGSGGSGGGMYE